MRKVISWQCLVNAKQVLWLSGRTKKMGKLVKVVCASDYDYLFTVLHYWPISVAEWHLPKSEVSSGIMQVQHIVQCLNTSRWAPPHMKCLS